MLNIFLRILDGCYWVLMIGAPKPAPRTRRTSFPHGLKQRMYRKQRQRCQYCGWQYDIDALHIDHMTPVDRGGANNPSNLQLLCAPCNLRKGIQTDKEFRRRYRRLLPRRKRAFPKRPVPQRELSSLTQRTTQPSSVSRHRRAKRYHPARRLGITALASGALGAVSYAGFIPEYTIALTAACAGALIVIIATTIRALATGKFERQTRE